MFQSWLDYDYSYDHLEYEHLFIIQNINFLYCRLLSLEEIIQILIISSKEINLQYIYKVYCRKKGQSLIQQKRDSCGITFYKNILPWIKV